MAEQAAPPVEPAAAPAVPAPAAEPAAAPAAPAGPAPGTTEAAIAAGRERVAAGESLIPGEPAGEQLGEHGETLTEETSPAGEQPPEGEAAPEPKPGEPEPVAGEPEPVAGEAPPEPAAELEPDPFVVTLAGLEDRGEGQIEIEVGDQETFERLNRINNGYQTGQQVKAATEQNVQKATQLEEVRDQIEIDPTGFVLEHVADDVRAEIAMQLIFDPTVLAQLRDRLGEGENPTTLAEILESPDSLRIVQAELKASRLETSEKLRAHNTEQKEMRANGEALMAEVNNLIPETITGKKRQFLFDDSMRDLTERCNRLGLKRLDPRDVKLIVSDRFREQGIDFAAPAPANAPAPAKPAAAAAPEQRTGAEFTQARTVKRAAAATAPAGAGAPAAQPKPTLPATTDERIKMARTKGLRYMLGKT